MEDLLIEILSDFGYPVMLQGSLADDEPYPDNFFTFYNNDSYSHFYDNNSSYIVYDYDVNFYSTDPERVYSVLREAVKKLRIAGFIVTGDGYTVGSDEQTHDGRGINVKCMKLGG